MRKDSWMKADEIVKSLSLKEKIGQLNQEMVRLYDTDSMELLKSRIRDGEVGSVILASSATAGNDGITRVPIHILNELQKVSMEETEKKIPLIFARDVIHGHNVVLPIPLGLAASFNTDIVKDGFSDVAKEASSEGINWSFTPMLDISRDSRWGRCVESFGEDPYLAERMAEAVIGGLQDNESDEDNIIACAKHYIGYGAGEAGRDYNKAEISDYTLRNYYLRPFRAAVNAGVGTVMNSFNELSGVSTAASRYLLYDVLKTELGFDGFVISDWGAVEQTINQGLAKDRKDAAKICINAGLDMDMVCRCYADHIEELVLEGKVTEETVSECARRIIYIKLIAGLFDKPYAKQLGIDFDKHIADAKKCADESMILLKNENKVLPLYTQLKVFAAGPFLYEKRSLLGTWCLDGDLDYVKSYYDVMKEKYPQLSVPSGINLTDDDIKNAENADAIVLFLGESHEETGEARCKTNIDLPREQLELVKAMKKFGKPVIGVMSFGRPIALEEAEPYFDAILYTWHCGTASARSATDILCGDVNPSGKVPMTFPRVTGQLPIYYNHSSGPRFANGYYGEDGIGGYNYLDCSSQPMYCFGYGLSYTTFCYGTVKADRKTISLEELSSGCKIKISVTVKNTGEFAGKEASQLYIRDLCASMVRPYRELKGISKNYFEPGQEKEVVFELGFEELAFYNAKGELKVECGEFEVYAGTDCYTLNKLIVEVI